MVACWFATSHPILELACHLSMHCLGLLAGVGASWAVFAMAGPSEIRRRLTTRLVLAWVIPFTYFFWITEPWSLVSDPQPATFSESIRILSWNIWLHNNRLAEAVQKIEDVDADVVFLFEVEEGMDLVLDRLSRRYPIRLWETDRHSGYFAVFSRVEGTKLEMMRFTPYEPAVLVTVPSSRADCPYRILGVHPLSPDPFRPMRTRVRDSHFDSMARWLRSVGGQAIILGDMNITPWSPVFRQFLAEGSLRDSRSGRGNQASWPSMLGSLGIPIDHVLTSSDYVVIDRSIVTRAQGSDHRPVLATIGLP
jgi:endonuclease/exonuclease/phosphatase (EEP) superfamily protein YafD